MYTHPGWWRLDKIIINTFNNNNALFRQSQCFSVPGRVGSCVIYQKILIIYDMCELYECGKAVVVGLQAGALGTAPQRGAACGAAGGAARSWAGSVPERRARGGERPGAHAGSAQLADRTTQDKRNARRRWETTKHTKQGGHPKQHGRQRRAGGGTGPPRCQYNCANNNEDAYVDAGYGYGS